MNRPATVQTLPPTPRTPWPRPGAIALHVLPLLIIIPLMDVAIIYALETQVLLPSLSKELAGEASLLAEIANSQPEIWKNPEFAQDILVQARPYLAARVMWLAPDSRLLASSDPTDVDRLGYLLEPPDFTDTRPGEVVSRTNFSQRLQDEIAFPHLPTLSQTIGSVSGVVTTLKIAICHKVLGRTEHASEMS